MSREAYNEFLGDSIRKLEWFVPPPLIGVWHICVSNLIDLDEAGFYLKGLASTHGCLHTSCHVYHPAYYRCSEPNVNLIMGVEVGDTRLPPVGDRGIQITY